MPQHIPGAGKSPLSSRLGKAHPHSFNPCALKAGKAGVGISIPGGSNLQEPLSLFLEQNEVTGWGNEIVAVLKNSLKNAWD